MTNDDGVSSSFLELTIGCLRSLGNLTVVAPREEQSWRGKAMTRIGERRVETAMVSGQEIFTVDGTPADCVNLALYHLLQNRPDVVVSGLNIGSNMGISFILSSGTIGAGFEANIAGIPAIAISQELESEGWETYRREGKLPAAVLDLVRCRTLPLIERCFDKWKAERLRCDRPFTMSANFPCRYSSEPRLIECPASLAMYRSCFQKNGAGFIHHLRDVDSDPRDECEEGVVRRGHVSISWLDMRGISKL